MEEGDSDSDAMARQIEEHGRAYDELWQWAHGKNVFEVEGRLREFTRTHAAYAREVDVVIQARVMSDIHWGVKHPVGALALAWRFRKDRSTRSTLKFFVRPRFAG
jgi:hypothetical protein